MPLTNAEWDSIMKDPSKRVDGDIEWGEDEHHSPARRFRARVVTAARWPLFVHGWYNPETGKLSYSLFLKTDGRIYGLDMGMDHTDPQGNDLGDPHKHEWSERYRDREGYAPEDITAPVSDPISVWRQFCAEAGIGHNGKMHSPPVSMGRLFP